MGKYPYHYELRHASTEVTPLAELNPAAFMGAYSCEEHVKEKWCKDLKYVNKVMQADGWREKMFGYHWTLYQKMECVFRSPDGKNDKFVLHSCFVSAFVWKDPD